MKEGMPQEQPTEHVASTAAGIEVHERIAEQAGELAEPERRRADERLHLLEHLFALRPADRQPLREDR